MSPATYFAPLRPGVELVGYDTHVRGQVLRLDFVEGGMVVVEVGNECAGNLVRSVFLRFLPPAAPVGPGSSRPVDPVFTVVGPCPDLLCRGRVCRLPRYEDPDALGSEVEGLLRGAGVFGSGDLRSHIVRGFRPKGKRHGLPGSE